MLRPETSPATALTVALRHTAAGHTLPVKPEEARLYVEGLMTDGAALVFELERERLAGKRRYRDALLAAAADPQLAGEILALHDAERELQSQLDELRGLLATVRQRFTIPADA